MAGYFSQPQVTSKADVDRAFYSEQNRQALLQQAGIAVDPLTQTYQQYVASRYAGVPPENYQPAVPLLGYMEAQKLAPLALPSGITDLGDVIRRSAIMHGIDPSKVTVNPSTPFNNVGGVYNKKADTITVNPSDNQSLQDVLEVFAHEAQHRTDQTGPNKVISLPYDKDTSGKYRGKSFHHKDFGDFEVDKPLFDLLVAAQAAGEKVNPDLLKVFQPLLEARKK